MKLADYIKQQNMKRRDFAKKAKISASHVSDLCNGKVWPRPKMIAHIARITKGAVTVNDFVDCGPSHGR